MKNLIIAKRYSRALFNLAEEAKAIEQLGTELREFDEFLKQFPDLGNALRNPLYPEAAKKKLFETVTSQVELSPIMKSFLKLLIEKKRIQYLPDIGDYYDRLIDEHSNIARAKVKAAVSSTRPNLVRLPPAWRRKSEKKSSSNFSRTPLFLEEFMPRLAILF